MTDPKVIAAGLSETSKAALLGPENVEMGAGTAAYLVRAGCIEADPRDEEGWRWSVTGLAVRAHLQAQEQNP